MFGFDDPGYLQEEIRRLGDLVRDLQYEVSKLKTERGAIEVLRSRGAKVVESPPNPSAYSGAVVITIDHEVKK